MEVMETWQLVSEVIASLEEQGYRPHVGIQTNTVGCCGIPSGIVTASGHVTLNVSRQATGDTLRIGKYQCQCSISINGQHHSIAWHPNATVLVYSPDGGPKLLLPEPDVDPDDTAKLKVVDQKKPHLHAVR